VFMYSRRNLRFDEFYELKPIHCFDCGESASDVGIGDHHLIGTLELDPGHPSSRDDPGEPAVPLCRSCHSKPMSIVGIGSICLLTIGH